VCPNVYLLAVNVAGACDVINPGGGKLGTRDITGGACPNDAAGRLSGRGAGNIPPYIVRVRWKAAAADDDNDADNSCR